MRIGRLVALLGLVCATVASAIPITDEPARPPLVPEPLAPGPSPWPELPLPAVKHCAKGLSYWECFSSYRPSLRGGTDGLASIIFKVGADGHVSNCLYDGVAEHKVPAEQACAYLVTKTFDPSLDLDTIFDVSFDWTVPAGLTAEAASKPATAATLVQTGYVRKLPNGKIDPCDTIMCSDDYPPAALRREITGVVIYNVLVTADGRPLSCWLTEPSNSSDLNEATCRLILNRARFNPALDEEGEARTAIYSGRMRWTLP